MVATHKWNLVQHVRLCLGKISASKRTKKVLERRVEQYDRRTQQIDIADRTSTALRLCNGSIQTYEIVSPRRIVGKSIDMWLRTSRRT
ncbi:MAG: hypothetical protein DWQ31_20005 [Planctomycetota bacterium]|nr:MAG: hypothetical protein DWQ31_20005 [Planctomycetota bacterium]REJ94045.1 MAG: hypothetical protein DWQ35_09195 [Planctomycetota bacterium]